MLKTRKRPLDFTCTRKRSTCGCRVAVAQSHRWESQLHSLQGNALESDGRRRRGNPIVSLLQSAHSHAHRGAACAMGSAVGVLRMVEQSVVQSEKPQKGGGEVERDRETTKSKAQGSGNRCATRHELNQSVHCAGSGLCSVHNSELPGDRSRRALRFAVPKRFALACAVCHLCPPVASPLHSSAGWPRLVQAGCGGKASRFRRKQRAKEARGKGKAKRSPPTRRPQDKHRQHETGNTGTASDARRHISRRILGQPTRPIKGSSEGAEMEHSVVDWKGRIKSTRTALPACRCVRVSACLSSTLTAWHGIPLND
jgi:hypothetical protein